MSKFTFMVFPLLFLSSIAFAHINGVPIIPKFASPNGIFETDNNELKLRWVDGDQDPSGIMYFFYSSQNATPDLVPQADLLSGEEIISIPVLDGDNQYPWDLTNVPPGVYYLYTQVIDPPYCERVVFADALVVHRNNAESPLFGGIFTQPGVSGSVVDGTSTIELLVLSPSPPVVTLQFGTTPQNAQFDPVDSDCSTLRTTWNPIGLIEAPLTVETASQLGDDYWKVTAQWDTDDIEPGSYLLQATLSNAESSERIIYASGWISIQPSFPGDSDTDSGTDSGTDSDTVAPPESDDRQTPSENSNAVDNKTTAASCNNNAGLPLPILWICLLLVFTRSERKNRLPIIPAKRQFSQINS